MILQKMNKKTSWGFLALVLVLLLLISVQLKTPTTVYADTVLPSSASTTTADTFSLSKLSRTSGTSRESRLSSTARNSGRPHPCRTDRQPYINSYASNTAGAQCLCSGFLRLQRPRISTAITEPAPILLPRYSIIVQVNVKILHLQTRHCVV